MGLKRKLHCLNACLPVLLLWSYSGTIFPAQYGELRHHERFRSFEKTVNFFRLVDCNPCWASLSLCIFISLYFIIISLVFFYLSVLLFLGFHQLKSNLVHDENNSDYCGLGLCRDVRREPELANDSRRLALDVWVRVGQHWKLCQRLN